MIIAKLSQLQRFSFFLAALGATIWLGGFIVRAVIGFDLFIPGTLTFKSDMPSYAQAQTLRLFAQSGLYTIAGYGLFIIAGGYLWFSYRHMWRTRGGLFMGGALFALYIPIELWQIYFDIQLIQLIQYSSYGNFPLDAAKKVFLQRLTVLGGAGASLSTLGYISAIFFLTTQTMYRDASQ
ncbi:MAG: hypothetical protein RML40_03265 [Bacteroidota bacterium]|nr:hypothetical protein [Candidatus Kapabacteria bacterium]MDW8219530.1 hypothetical protein [Bacteroidota bacterium]